MSVLIQKKYVNILKNVLKNNLNATNEKVLIIYDLGDENKEISKILAYHFKEACLQLKLEYELFLIRKIVKGDLIQKELEEKLLNFPSNNIILANTSNGIGYTTKKLKKARYFFKKKKHKFILSSSLGTLNNSQLETFMNCLDLDHEKLHEETKKIADIIDKAQEIKVTTSAGTNITFSVKNHEAKISTGLYKNPGEGGNLPGSEAYIAPDQHSVNGVLIIDGSSKVDNGTMNIKNPIKLIIKNGIVEAIEGKAEAYILKQTLKNSEYRTNDPISCYKIGEFGIGTNKRAKILGATIVDEKTYGTVHFAIGSNNWFGGEIVAPIHLDQVIKDPTIIIDGKILKY